MDVFDRQSFYTKLKFIKNANRDHNVAINIVLSTNHSLKDDLIKDIESKINSILLNDYMKESDYKLNQDREKQRERQKKAADRLLKEAKKQKVKELKEQNKLAKQFGL